MFKAKPTVFVVDDDESVRESLKLLIESQDWNPQTFASAREFLSQPPTPGPSCLVLDRCLPDLDGLDVQRLVADRRDMPIIFITGYGDMSSVVRAMKAGAVEFLAKPIVGDRLISAIQNAIDRSRAELDHTAESRCLRDRFASLSGREQQVMAFVVCGWLNKQVAGELGISEITIKAHRGRMMRKMGAASLPELVMMAAQLRLMPQRFGRPGSTQPPAASAALSSWPEPPRPHVQENAALRAA